jgi:hypothetical protein
MSATSRTTVRRARKALVSLTVAGSGLAALFGATGAASASPSGIVTVLGCSSVVGTAHYTPGLLKTTARQTTATLSASVAGCTSEFTGAMLGAGTLTAQLSGSASVTSEGFADGTFTVKYPSASLNPSSGTVSVYDYNGAEYFEGTITSGAFTGAPINFAYVITSSRGTGSAANPVKSQHFSNSAALTVTENFG